MTTFKNCGHENTPANTYRERRQKVHGVSYYLRCLTCKRIRATRSDERKRSRPVAQGRCILEEIWR